MASLFRNYWALVAVAIGIAAIVALNIKPYHWNVTSLFNMDPVGESQINLPDNFVVLEGTGYDGMYYYQIARRFPTLFTTEGRTLLEPHSTISYAYQRILLPALASALALGKTALLPYSFLIINVLSLILAAYVTLKSTNKPLAALAIAFCPSAMVGLHFSLAEPLGLLLIALFLTRYVRLQKISWIEVAVLSALVLSREVNILFIAIITLYSLYRHRWHDAVFMLIPIFVFLAWHSTLYIWFSEIPFLTSAGARQFPLSAPLRVLFGLRGYDMYTLSSVALFLGFTVPGVVWTVWKLIKGDRSFVTIAFFLFLCLMVTLADYIWGSVTSVGRVITPIYPLAIMAYVQSDTKLTKWMLAAIPAIGLAAGISLALISHPFFLT